MMRRVGLQAAGGALFVFALGLGLGSSVRAQPAAAEAGGSESSGTVRMEDDRGRALDSPVEACFVHELSTDCVEVSADRAVLELRPFDSMRIEGPDHGPVRVRPQDVERSAERGGEGPPRLTVPRKTLLRVRRAPERGLSANLYRPPGDFTRPAHAFDLARAPDAGEGGPVERKVPAGEWVLALESRGLAPQLRSLVGERTAEPGGQITITHRPRDGWSLVLRAVDWEDEEPVDGVDVRVTPMAPEAAEGEESDGERGARSSEPRRRTTSSAGLALVSGIERPLADASVEHPDFVATEVPAIGGEPGAIVVRKVTLEPGGTVEVAIRVDGEPAVGWRCRLLDRTRGGAGAEPGPRRIGEADSDPEGLCRMERVPAGVHWFRADPPEEVESSATVEEELAVVNGETERLDLDLYPILVEGDVLRGGEPAPGYLVEAYWVGDRSSSTLDEPLTVAETDEEGAYELSVWKPGTHFFSVRDAEASDARFVAARREEVSGPSERIDFRLTAANLEGVVVSRDGEPVPGVPVSVRIRSTGAQQASGSLSTVTSGEDGRFTIPLEDARVEVELSVRSARYASGEPRVVSVREGEVPPPVVLTVEERRVAEGRLLGASGGPVAGGWIGLYPATAPAASATPLQRLSQTRTEADGSFRMPDPEAGPYRLYATGSGCPLTVRNLTEIPAEGWTVSCEPGSGHLNIRLRTPEGGPADGVLFMLRLGDQPIPLNVLVVHLRTRGVAFETDGSGKMAIPDLPPGPVDVFILAQDGRGSLLGGRLVQLIGSVTVTPGGVAELETTVAAVE